MLVKLCQRRRDTRLPDATTRKWRRACFMGTLLLLATTAVLASGGGGAPGSQTLGGLAQTVTKSFEDIVKLITAVCYVAGIGFAAAGIMKFKQHKDNPTQVPLGGPIAMIFIAAALIWLPGIIGATGATIFGTKGQESARSTATGVDPFASKSSGSGG